MTSIFLLLVLLAALLALSLIAASKALDTVTKAIRYSDEEVRDLEVRNGFADALASYARHEAVPFTLQRPGAVISGEYVRNPAAEGQRPKVAVVCHGHTVCRLSCIKYAEIFYRAGYHVLIYDERYFGRSEAKFCTLGQEEAKDLAAVLRYARSVFGADALLAVHGESMGAATALLSLQYAKSDYIIADCPFCDTKLLVSQWIGANTPFPAWFLLPSMRLLAKWKYHYDFYAVSPLRAVDASDVPICLMHGEADTLIPISHSETLYAACRNKKSELHRFAGANHAESIILHRAQYEQRMLDFIRKCEES